MSGIGVRRWSKIQHNVLFTIGDNVIKFPDDTDSRGGLKIPGDTTWRLYTNTFDGAGHEGASIAIRAEERPGVCIDAVCLVPIADGAGMGQDNLDPASGSGWTVVGPPRRRALKCLSVSV